MSPSRNCFVVQSDLSGVDWMGLNDFLFWSSFGLQKKKNVCVCERCVLLKRRCSWTTVFEEMASSLLLQTGIPVTREGRSGAAGGTCFSRVGGKLSRGFSSPAGPAGVCVQAGVPEVRRGQAEPAQPGQLHGPHPGHLSVWERVLDGACVLLRPGQK